VRDPADGIVVTSPDPTQNVRELVDAANLRSDDLRAAEARRVDQALSAEGRRVDQAIEGLRREAELRADFASQLALAETKRIDAIRAVDVAAVAIANERATAQATVLANQVATSAETLRALVATQAAASAQQFSTSTQQLSDRISLLERSNYQGEGRSTLADPAMLKMATALELMQASMSSQTGKGQGISSTMAVILSVLGGFGVIGGLVAAFTTLGAP
jgi:hypothetical protein